MIVMEAPPPVVFDVAVVGGGVMGAAAAYHAARRGLSCALLERYALGGHERGSSHGPSRIVRRTYPSTLYTTLMRRAYELWHEAEGERAALGLGAAEGPLLERGVGGGLDLCDASSRVLAELRAACAAVGVPLETLDADAAHRRFGLRLRASEVAVHQRDTCVAAASRCVAGFQLLARARGAALLGNAEVVSVEREAPGGGALRPFAVATADGRCVRARRVIVCPGPWAAPLLERLFGLRLRLQVWQCTTAFFERRPAPADTGRCQSAVEPLPVLIDYGERPLWARRQGGDDGAAPGPVADASSSSATSAAAAAAGGALADDDELAQPIYSCPCIGEPGRAKFAIHRGVDTTADDRSFEPTLALLAPVQAWLRKRLPDFDAEAPLDASTCLYTMTADEDFVIDALDGDEAGVIVACGFSGHGFKFAPVIGALLAAMASAGAEGAEGAAGGDSAVAGAVAEALGPGVDAAEVARAFSLKRAALQVASGALNDA